MKTKPLPAKFQDWIDAQKKYRLSDTHIQMARELGLNPKKLDKIDNHQQEPWKVPLSVFIKTIYFKRFAKTCPDKVKSIKHLFEVQQQKKVVERVAKISDCHAENLIKNKLY